MEKIIAQRLLEGHSDRKMALGAFLQKNAEMLRNQRIQDGVIAEKFEQKA